MPRGFLVKRSRRASAVSYRTRCCCPAAGGEPEPPPPARRPAPPAPPPFGTPEAPPPPAAHSPARAVSEERRLPLGSPLSAESFPAPDPPPAAELQLWAAPPPPSKRPPARKGKGASASARRLALEDEVTTSPVLGLRIKEGPPEAAAGGGGGGGAPLGEFVCQLCKERYPDPLALAQHKCSRIVRVEYRCPECDKLFSCPANLASHRRWHKPRPPGAPAAAAPAKPAKEERVGPPSPSPSPAPAGAPAEELACPRCAKRFRRQSALRKHLPVHRPPPPPPPAEGPDGAEAALGPVAAAAAGEGHPCPVCGEPFPSKSGQERHLRLLHAAQAFPCKYCPATFYSSPGLTRHINKCHPSENRQVILLQVPVRPAC